MTREQFNNLKVGDIVTPAQGYDKGLECIVRYIEDETILFKICNGNFDRRSNSSNGKFKINCWKMVDLITKVKDS